MNVTIAYLRAFLEVGRALNFSRAAEKLSLTQPSLSMSIQQLEKALNVKLLDRTTRKIHLTEEGAAFLVTVERLLDEFDTAMESMRSIAERRGGRVSIATLPSIATTFIPIAVASFSNKYPGIRVHLRDDNTPNVWARVQRGDVDFGMAGDFKPIPELEFVPLLSDKFGVVMRKDHPLARSDGAMEWNILADRRMIGLAPDTGPQPLLSARRSIPESVRFPSHEASNIITLVSLVEAGLGIAVIPAFAAMLNQHPSLHFRELVRPTINRRIGFVLRKGRTLSPAAESLKQEILSVLAAPPKNMTIL